MLHKVRNHTENMRKQEKVANTANRKQSIEADPHISQMLEFSQQILNSYLKNAEVSDGKGRQHA